VSEVDSESVVGRHYRVERKGAELRCKGSNGQWCKSFIFSKAKPKTCKHIYAATIAHDRPVIQQGGDRVTVTLEGGKTESFTVHRAIVVGGGKLT